MADSLRGKLILDPFLDGIQSGMRDDLGNTDDGLIGGLRGEDRGQRYKGNRKDGHNQTRFFSH